MNLLLSSVKVVVLWVTLFCYSFFCVLSQSVCAITTRRSVCAPLRWWQLALSAPCHKEAVTAGVWPTSSPPAHLLHPCSLAWPATLLVARSVFRSALHMGLVSHGNQLRPIRSSRQLGFPSIVPPLLSCRATSNSFLLQWLQPPPCAQNHVKLMGTPCLALGWKHFLTADSMHTYLCYCKSNRCTHAIHSLRCLMLCFVSGLTTGVGPMTGEKYSSVLLRSSLSGWIIGRTALLKPSKHFQALYRRWFEKWSIIHSVWSNQGSLVTVE